VPIERGDTGERVCGLHVTVEALRVQTDERRRLAAHGFVGTLVEKSRRFR
jgi:hypothetical protein